MEDEWMHYSWNLAMTESPGFSIKDAGLLKYLKSTLFSIIPLSLSSLTRLEIFLKFEKRASFLVNPVSLIEIEWLLHIMNKWMNEWKGWGNDKLKMYVYCSCVAPLLMKYQQTQLATQEPQNKGENLNQTKKIPNVYK